MSHLPLTSWATTLNLVQCSVPTRVSNLLCVISLWKCILPLVQQLVTFQYQPSCHSHHEVLSTGRNEQHPSSVSNTVRTIVWALRMLTMIVFVYVSIFPTVL